MTAAIWAVLFLAAALGFWIDVSPPGRYLSGAAVAVLATLALSNLKILPASAAPYDVVWNDFVPLAIPLLLFKANLIAILRESGILMAAFLIGSAGVLLGTFIGLHILPLGAHGADLAGMFSATYIGGSMNFAAVAQALQVTDKDLLAAAVAADNVAGITFLILITSLPAMKWAVRFLPERDGETAAGSVEDSRAAVPLNLIHLTLGIGLSFAIVAVSKEISAALGIASFSILFVTAIAVALATAFPEIVGRLAGDYEIGIGLMYVFFASIGAGADIRAMLGALPIFGYSVIIISFHALVLFGLARLFRFSLAEVILASCSCILGPTVSAAIAGARGWNKLITPGILTGIFGYVIATFLGVAIAEWLG